MLLTPSNFLLLDEPTNHLDMRAKDVLLEALEKFTGTVVFVSHDRYFLEHLANRVFEVAGGDVHVFPGNFADYLWRKQGGAEKAPSLDDILTGMPPAQPITIPSPAGSAPVKRINPIKLKQMQQQAKQLEDKIAELEAEIQKGELRLSDFVGADEALRLSNLVTTQRADLETAMEEWERLTQEMEATA
jgi:ATP-binding cassette subfamily F protein 3